MKTWPGFEVKVTPTIDKYKAIGKTKLPCGTPLITTAESEHEPVATAMATGDLLSQAKQHVDSHKCGS